MKSFFLTLGPALFVIPPAVLAYLYKCLGQAIALPQTLGIGSAGISIMLQFYSFYVMDKTLSGKLYLDRSCVLSTG